jgi:hypothetical protein
MKILKVTVHLVMLDVQPVLLMVLVIPVLESEDLLQTVHVHPTPSKTPTESVLNVLQNVLNVLKTNTTVLNVLKTEKPVLNTPAHV